MNATLFPKLPGCLAFMLLASLLAATVDLASSSFEDAEGRPAKDFRYSL